MLTWFIDWTTQLNQSNHIAFAIVTVLTMSCIGVAIAVTVELILRRLSGGKSSAAGDHGAGH